MQNRFTVSSPNTVPQLAMDQQQNHGLPSTLSLFKYQVSGKAPKFITPDNQIILKCYNDTEYLFYNYFKYSVHLGHQSYPLYRFLPQFHGKIQLEAKPDIQYRNDGQNKEIAVWLEHVKLRYDKKNEHDCFILIQNFLNGYEKPNILDIKIGGRQQKPKKITKSVAQFKLKLNGMFKTYDSTQFLSKYVLNQVTSYSELALYIAYFFTEGNQLKIQFMKKIQDQLQNLILALRSARGWRFVSSSICIIYDMKQPPSLDKVKLKFIDFGRATNLEMNEMYDEETCAGLQYALHLIKQVLQNKEKYRNIVINKKDIAVVPKQKIIKFEGKNGIEN